MSLIHRSLKDAVTDGGDIEARSNMMAASLMGATAFQKGLGAMHAIAHPVGATWDAHHGLINAVVMPHVLRFNMSSIGDKLAHLARVLALPQSSPHAVVDWVHELKEHFDIPDHLSELGPTMADVDQLTPQVVTDPSGGTNPLPLHAANVRNLLKSCIGGQ